MKFNWGHGLSIAIVVAVLLILTLVFFSSREKIELVTEDYYPKELRHEEQIVKLRNSKSLKIPITIEVKDSLIIKFPKIVSKHSEIDGEVWFYRASDIERDIKKNISLNDEFNMSFPLSSFVPGKYKIIIDWKAGEKEYLHQENWFVQ